MDSGVTYNSATGFTITPADLANLVQMGILVPNGTNIGNTTMVTFDSLVTLNAATGVTVTIPSGTTLTAGSASNLLV